MEKKNKGISSKKISTKTTISVKKVSSTKKVSKKTNILEPLNKALVLFKKQDTTTNKKCSFPKLFDPIHNACINDFDKDGIKLKRLIKICERDATLDNRCSAVNNVYYTFSKRLSNYIKIAVKLTGFSITIVALYTIFIIALIRNKTSRVALLKFFIKTFTPYKAEAPAIVDILERIQTSGLLIIKLLTEPSIIKDAVEGNWSRFFLKVYSAIITIPVPVPINGNGNLPEVVLVNVPGGFPV